MDMAGVPIWHVFNQSELCSPERPTHILIKKGYSPCVKYVPEMTCSVESSHGYTDMLIHNRYVHELSCHTLDEWPDPKPPSFCPYCGAKVVSE